MRAVGGTCCATLPAFRELRLQPFPASITVPMGLRPRRRIGLPVDDPHRRLPVPLVFDPDIGPALIHRNLARPALKVNPAQAASNTCLFQQVDPVLAQHQIRSARQSDHGCAAIRIHVHRAGVSRDMSQIIVRYRNHSSTSIPSRLPQYRRFQPMSTRAEAQASSLMASSGEVIPTDGATGAPAWLRRRSGPQGQDSSPSFTKPYLPNPLQELPLIFPTPPATHSVSRV